MSKPLKSLILLLILTPLTHCTFAQVSTVDVDFDQPAWFVLDKTRTAI